MNQWTPTALISLCTLNSIRTVRAKHTTGSELTIAWPLVAHCAYGLCCCRMWMFCYCNPLSIEHSSLIITRQKQQICLRIFDLWWSHGKRNKQTAKKNRWNEKQKRLIEFNCSSRTATRQKINRLCKGDNDILIVWRATVWDLKQLHCPIENPIQL